MLKQKGIDPNLDRGATALRAAYYGMVLIAWIVSGYSYLTVREVYIEFESSFDSLTFEF